MEKVDIIIPIHNLKNRRFKRLNNLCHSLELQKDKIGNVFFPDSSREIEYNMADNMINMFDFVRHFKVDKQIFNKPFLINEAIKQSTSDYIFLSDCDYLFSSDLLEHCERYRSPERILFKKVLELPNLTITKERVRKWAFTHKKPHEWGQIANGAMQYAHRGFFIKAIDQTPEYLEMEGWGAMDNIMAYMAYNHGLEIHWLGEGEILHQYHKREKYRNAFDKQRFDRNQTILASYINKYNLPQLLSKDA